MMDHNMKINDRIMLLQDKAQDLRKKLLEVEKEINNLTTEQLKGIHSSSSLSNDDISRYSRQIIIPEIGVAGQLLIKKASVLIVGAGGLGCPCALYLAGAGVGHIGIVDYDTVERDNLHRQVLHTEDQIGAAKVESAARSLYKLNSSICVTPHRLQLDSNNALDLISQYDVVVDATDNVATRYLLNDACVLSDRPLVSGSALQMEGQLTVYHYNDGPCYRCLFPVPPNPETVTNCADGGVLGAVPGVIGVLQALETIKIILDHPDVLSGRLLVFDGTRSSFRAFKLRKKIPTCDVCSENNTVTKLIDYEQFCQSKATDKDPKLNILSAYERVTPLEYKTMTDEDLKPILIDVRSSSEFEICRLSPCVNIPINDILENKSSDKIRSLFQNCEVNQQPVFLVCRRGNDSQKAVRHLKDSFEEAQKIPVKDIAGGLHAWAREVDHSFPIY